MLQLSITLLGIASPSQRGENPVFAGLPPTEAQIDFSETLLVYAIPTFLFQGSYTSQFSVTEDFKRWPPNTFHFSGQLRFLFTPGRHTIRYNENKKKTLSQQ